MFQDIAAMMAREGVLDGLDWNDARGAVAAMAYDLMERGPDHLLIRAGWMRAEVHNGGPLHEPVTRIGMGTPGEGAWRRGLRYLRAYVAQHGTATPPVHTVVDTFPLGQWVAARRRDYRGGRPLTDRVRPSKRCPAGPGTPTMSGGDTHLAEPTFFAASLTEITRGGWLPLGVAAVVFTVLMIRRRSRILSPATAPPKKVSSPSSSITYTPWILRFAGEGFVRFR